MVMTIAAKTELPATERFSVRICLRRAWVSDWILVGASSWISVDMESGFDYRLSFHVRQVIFAKLHWRKALKQPICYDEGAS